MVKSRKSGPVGLVMLGLCCVCARAEITYVKEFNTIIVANYPESGPATLADILAADRNGGWGKVSYDQATDSYKITTDLQVGTEASYSTCFQVGSKSHRRETLILAGYLMVKKSKIGFVNQLQIGDESDPEITPFLKFACEPDKHYGMKQDVFARGFNRPIFRMYHTRVSPTIEDADHLMGYLTPNYLRLIWKDCDISWTMGGIVETIGYPSLVERLKLSHGDIGVRFQSPASLTIRDCVVSGFKRGAASFGTGSHSLSGFEFKNNEIDISLPHGEQVVLVNCWISGKNNYLRGWRGKNASITYKRYLILKVVDTEGNLLKDVLVDVKNEVPDGPAPENGRSITDKEGLTPEASSGNAITVVDCVDEGLGSTKDSGGEYKTISFTYAVKLAAEGYRDAVIRGINPDNSWYGKEVTLTMKMRGK